MVLNSTLFVQMIHFFIAYAILRHFFFLPLFELIEEQENEQKEMEQALALNAQLVSLREQALTQQWQNYKNQFIHRVPSASDIHENIFKNLTPDQKQYELSPQEIQTMTTELSTHLAKRLQDVY